MAFNVTVYEYENTDYVAQPIEEEPFAKIIRTPAEEKKKLPPPDLKPSDKIIDDDQEFKEDPVPEPIDTEVKVDTQILKPASPLVINTKPKPPAITPLEDDDVEDMEFIVVEDMPRFPGCEKPEMTKAEKQSCANKTLLEYIYKNIEYPKMASRNGIEGTVVVDFVVEKNGQITDVNIRKEIGGGCGNEVVRIVKGMPEWVPGKQRNEKVRVRFTMPVKFQLQ